MKSISYCSAVLTLLCLAATARAAGLEAAGGEKSGTPEASYQPGCCRPLGETACRPKVPCLKSRWCKPPCHPPRPQRCRPPVCLSTCYKRPTPVCVCPPRKCCPPEIIIENCSCAPPVILTPPPCPKPVAPPTICCCEEGPACDGGCAAAPIAPSIQEMPAPAGRAQTIDQTPDAPAAPRVGGLPAGLLRSFD